MVIVAQLVRALDCGSKGRGFESHLSPKNQKEEDLKPSSFSFVVSPGIEPESKV